MDIELNDGQRNTEQNGRKTIPVAESVQRAVRDVSPTLGFLSHTFYDGPRLALVRHFDKNDPRRRTQETHYDVIEFQSDAKVDKDVPVSTGAAMDFVARALVKNFGDSDATRELVARAKTYEARTAPKPAA